MKRIDKNKQIKLNGLTCLVQNDPVFESLSDYGMYVDILQSIKDQLDAILSRCKVVRVYRFDLRAKKGFCLPSDNRAASTFIKRLTAKVQRLEKNTELRYVWVREQEANNVNQHYHFVLMMDSALYLSRRQLKDLVKSIEQSLGVSVWWCKANERQTYNSFPTSNKLVAVNTSVNRKAYLREVFRLSYLAKVRTKDNCLRGDNVNDYSSSQSNANANSTWQPYADERQTLTAKLFEVMT